MGMIAFAPVFFDWGYFLGFDLKDLGALTVEAQTYIVSTGAIMTALAVWDRHAANHADPVTTAELVITLVMGSLLIPTAVVNKISILTCRGDPKVDDGKAPVLGQRPIGAAAIACDLRRDVAPPRARAAAPRMSPREATR